MILLTGGSGVLGKELQKRINCYAPKHEFFDITKERDFNRKGDISLIIHAAAYTDVAKAEKEKKKCYIANVLGTRNLAESKIPMLYISTEYVFDGAEGDYHEDSMPNPRNFYAFTKLLGEYECRRTKSVVIRCLFKANPYKHEYATVDQYTSGGYVEEIAPEIVKILKIFHSLPPTIHIGLKKTSILELARKTRNVRPTTVQIIEESAGVKLPKDTSLDLTLWNRIKKDNNL